MRIFDYDDNCDGFGRVIMSNGVIHENIAINNKFEGRVRIFFLDGSMEF